MQDAFASAVEHWPRTGAPLNPGAWVLTVARNRAIERIRRDRTLAGKRELLARLEADAPPEPDMTDDAIPDERLSLVFACCHPALATEAQVALTLRLLGGLTTAEIARAFLVPEPTMAQRLLRAKRKVRTAGHPDPRAGGPRADRPAPARPRGRLPRLQPGLRPAAARRAARRGDPPRASSWPS